MSRQARISLRMRILGNLLFCESWFSFTLLQAHSHPQQIRKEKAFWVRYISLSFYRLFFIIRVLPFPRENQTAPKPVHHCLAVPNEGPWMLVHCSWRGIWKLTTKPFSSALQSYLPIRSLETTYCRVDSWGSCWSFWRSTWQKRYSNAAEPWPIHSRSLWFSTVCWRSCRWCWPSKKKWPRRHDTIKRKIEPSCRQNLDREVEKRSQDCWGEPMLT